MKFGTLLLLLVTAMFFIPLVCGYEYDPEIGDPDGGIKPGTKFEDIPEDWVCPLCGVTKSDFEKMQ